MALLLLSHSVCVFFLAGRHSLEATQIEARPDTHSGKYFVCDSKWFCQTIRPVYVVHYTFFFGTIQLLRSVGLHAHTYIRSIFVHRNSWTTYRENNVAAFCFFFFIRQNVNGGGAAVCYWIFFCHRMSLIHTRNTVNLLLTLLTVYALDYKCCCFK